MPSRFTPLVNEEFYHVFNRGVAHQPIFNLKVDYQRFLHGLFYYRFNNLPFRLSNLLQTEKIVRNKWLAELEAKNDKSVELIAYCLMPNHFHLLIQQKTESGISTFIRKLTNSYTRYFNTKYSRVGPVFQGAFKAVHVDTNEQLLHLSRYIHLNPLVSYIVKEKGFPDYPWSSLNIYLKRNSSLVDAEPVINQFPKDSYYQFVLDQADYGKKLEAIKHLILD